MSGQNEAIACDELNKSDRSARSVFGDDSDNLVTSPVDTDLSANDISWGLPSFKSGRPRSHRCSLAVVGGTQPRGSKVHSLILEGLGPNRFLQAIQSTVHPMEADSTLQPDVGGSVAKTTG